MELTMFDKIKDIFKVLNTGKMVADPVAWKKGQITGGLVAGFLGALIALAKGFGYVIPLTDDQLLQIGGAVVAVFSLFNAGATVVSTDKLGLSPRPEAERVPEQDQPVESCVPEPSAIARINEIKADEVPHVRRAANGDVLDGLDTTYTGA
jgi:hypothetical protein